MILVLCATIFVAKSLRISAANACMTRVYAMARTDRRRTELIGTRYWIFFKCARLWVVARRINSVMGRQILLTELVKVNLELKDTTVGDSGYTMREKLVLVFINVLVPNVCTSKGHLDLARK